MRVDKLVRLPSSSARPLTPPHRGSEANQRDQPGAGADWAHHWHAPTSKNMSDDHRTGRLCADAARLGRRHFVRKSMRPRMSLRSLGMQPQQPRCEPLVGSAVVVEQCRGIFERAYLQYVCSDSCAESSSEAVTDASCKLRHKGTRDHARERPHRRPCHPLIIHLAPIDSMLCCGPAAKRSAAQNRTKRRPATINPLPLPLQRSAVSRVARPNHGQHAIVSPWHHVQ